MSKQANPKVIGFFVLGAIVLVVAALLIFGSGKYFKETLTFVMYFDGSVTGLDEGAPVRLRGVKIGTVTEIDAIYDPESDELQIPVYIEVIQGAVKSKTERKEDRERTKRDIQRLIKEQGLRAQLVLQSLVTGKLYIEIKFKPETPINYVEDEGEYIQIPTLPSAVQEIRRTVRKAARKLADLPLDKIAERALHLIEGVDNKVNAPEVDETLAALQHAVKSFDQLAQELRDHVGPLLASATGTLEDTRLTLKDARHLMRNVDSQVDPVSKDLKKTMASARKALASAQRTLESVDNFVGDKSPLRYNLQTTLEQLSSAARSIRQMADYIERHPDALIYGKGRTRGR